MVVVPWARSTYRASARSTAARSRVAQRTGGEPRCRSTGRRDRPIQPDPR
jgi:hypothetical protein